MARIPGASSVHERSIAFNYFVNTYFDANAKKVSAEFGVPVRRVEMWMRGDKIPQKATLEYLCNLIFTPEFKVIQEFYHLESSVGLRKKISDMFKGHGNASGIYAFYDSMANLLYVGKASNLSQEVFSALNRKDEVKFPSGVQNKTHYRYEIVKYVSAYEVKLFKWFDYPKHVESMILRISKPRLNKQIGRLARAYPEIEKE